MKSIKIYDTTLRDGAQCGGISFSVSDKIKIVKALDRFKIDYIEAGYPSSNPKDAEFFEQMKEITLSHSKLCAFGSTVKYGNSPDKDPGITSLVEAGTEIVTIFGKASLEQATQVLHLSGEENISIITLTIEYLVSLGKRVFFDAEHFYKGYIDNKEYTLSVLDAAKNAGAEVLCLCDTNGDILPDKAYEITKEICDRYSTTTVAVHFHDDIGCAVADSMLASKAGASHVQGTFLGFGERCGNADLSVVIPNLKFKCGYEFGQDMRYLKKTAMEIAEISNVRIRNNKPYVGKNAFYHKAGMHIDAVKKLSSSFEHIEPTLVGNERKFLLSEMSGRTTILDRVRLLVPELDKNSPELLKVLDTIKEKEHFGYQYEAADASLQLLIAKTLYRYTPHFNVLLYKTTDDFPIASGELNSAATVQIEVDGKTETTASLGNGPVNALDLALRKALKIFYPQIEEMNLIDFKVRVIDAGTSTAAKVRVLIETSDGVSNWTTVGVSYDIIEACFVALLDSFEFKLSMP